MAVTGSVQQKGKKWYMVINRYNDEGKRKPQWISTGLTVKGNKRAAQQMLADKLAEINKYCLPICGVTVADYFEKWLLTVKSSVRPNTYRAYLANMNNHIIPYFTKKKTKLQDLTAKDLEEYYRFKLQSGSKINSEEALSATTIKHHHQNISTALSEAVREGIISNNPASIARTPKMKQYKADYLNVEQLGKLLALFKGSNIELPVSLCVVYGFRRSEVLGLKWKHVDFQNKTITIAETLQQNTGGDYTDDTKTESSYRTLPMTDDIYCLLQNKKEQQETLIDLMGDSYHNDYIEYVCTHKDGRIITPNYLTTHFHSTLEHSSLPLIRFHDLRHSVSSNLLNNGFSVTQVQEWLGHSSATTTLKYYAHIDASSKKEVASALQKMISFQ